MVQTQLVKSPVNFYDKDDLVSEHDKNIMKLLSINLLKESKLRIRQLQGIGEKYERDQAFNIGIVLGRVREIYKEMIATYRANDDLWTGKVPHTLYPPGIRELKSLHFVVAMERVRIYEIEIDKLINTLEFKAEIAQMTITTKPSPIPGIADLIGLTTPSEIDKSDLGLTTAPTSPSKKSLLRRQFHEEQLKSKMREQYLIKKLRLGRNTTEKKRFLRGWPVEETWSFDGDYFAHL